VKGGDVESVDAIAAGSGAVLRRGIHKVAIYRDPLGEVHEMSAACTHLGCIVRWNAADKTWDCKCHGSRFDALGHVLSGPANTPLRAVETPGAVHVRNTRQGSGDTPTSRL
jgi:Rieske Fe-S protein